MAFQGWERTKITTNEGLVEGIAPVIISASRSTDIPAFFADWFIQRLRKGYVRWTNPFNQRCQYVSFEKARVVVFWTKNAKPMLRQMDALDDAGIHYYFTYTLNDYEQEGIEPNLPKLHERIETFSRLSDRIGPERVIWRFDPIILGGSLTPEVVLERVGQIGDALQGVTRKLVISFADISIYAKVRRNLAAAGFGYLQDPLLEQMEAVAEGLQVLNRRWGYEIASCAEPVDLARFSIRHNRCIDDELMARVFGDDLVLMEFLGRRVESNLTLFAPGEASTKNRLKDKGQREACGCIVSKDIGEYSTCMHLCRYCYANASEKAVREKLKRMKSTMEEQ